MHIPKWSLFYDFHTMPAQPDVGQRFDAEAAADAWKSLGVDFVVFHARDNLGNAYYDTKLGIRHPSLKYDLFGRLAEACNARAIALSAYFNVGLSHEEALRRRDWLVLGPDGSTYWPDRMDHFMRRMCYNTGYAEHLCAMIAEVAERYPVAGFFLDCMHTSPCVGVECVREMKAKGIDWRDPAALAEFSRVSQVRMARRIRDAALAARPDLLLYFNGVSFEDQADIGTYLEFECLPTGGWGYESLPAYARYLRTLGKPALNMTGRFHRSWADFGGIRTEPSLEYDCLFGLANGLRPTIGDHWHPRGDVNHEVLGLIGRVYGRLRGIEPYVEDAVPACDTAILARSPPFGPNVLGAVRMLSELKAQFDLVTAASQRKDYRLLVLPDAITLDGALAAMVHEHLERGGAVLSTGWSGLDPTGQDFALPAWGMRKTGEDPAPEVMAGASELNLHLAPYPAYFRVRDKLAQGLPDMPLNCYVRGIVAEPGTGTENLGNVMSSYFPQHWDGEHHHLYIPPDALTERAFVMRRGSIVQVTHPLFSAYHQFAPVPLKQLVANVLAMLNPRPLLRAENLPSFARATVTAQEKRRMVYVMGYVPERRGAAIDMIEEPVELRDVWIGLTVRGRGVRRVFRAPSGEELPFTLRDGYATVTVSSVRGWALLVFEDA